MTRLPPSPPALLRAGDVYVDGSGQHWQVDEVIRSDKLAGFYLVRLRSGASPEALGPPQMLGRREFLALWRERGLRATHAPQ